MGSHLRNTTGEFGERRESRRKFIQGAAAAVAAASQPLRSNAFAQTRKVNIFVHSDASDSSVRQEPVRWAVEELHEALDNHNLKAEVHHNLDRIHEEGERVLVAPGSSALAREVASRAGARIPATAESFALAAGQVHGEWVLLATGSDVRGLVYCVLELADRVRHAREALAEIHSVENVVEQPANQIRSMTRLFVSEIEDKPWFHDKRFWTDYLSMLIAQRFNRFSLTLGLGYDSPIRVLDSYFIFAYPYLLSVPGYNVKVSDLAREEPERNLAMLRWISDEAARRGLHFQLGLWSHSHECFDSPNVNHLVEGLTPANHARYCRDALRALLQACPSISGITFRAHSESGVPDGSHRFWQTVFEGVADCGRRVEIDLHAKGIDFEQIRLALDTGQPVRVSPKLTSEHMGLPAHQAAIREQERSPSPKSGNPRNSTARYGYADYLSEDRAYGVYFRIWPGKQKVLLWGDPALAAGYGRCAGFCGSEGLEVCEPLSFKGRQGSGASPERRIYADNSLAPEGGDWRKYLYSYRIWGRHLYDPNCSPHSYRRYLRAEFGPAAAAPVEISLGQASRILPLITSAHLPSASAMTYWPELYTNMPIANRALPHPYGDTPSPKVFGRVSPLDPAMFCSIDEFVDELIGKSRSGRYSPAEVARWLDDSARVSAGQLGQARANVADANAPSFRRLEVDVAVLSGLGMFFANKLRAGIAYTLYERQSDTDALRDAVHFYRKAREAWDGITRRTRGVYVKDLGFGELPHRRGHWEDRLPAIEQDLAYMEKLLKEKDGEGTPGSSGKTAEDWLRPRPPAPECEHRPPLAFHPKRPLVIRLTSSSSRLRIARLHYRRVNQSEAYQIVDMQGQNGAWRHTIPDGYTDSAFPLLYYFELRDDAGNAWLFPGFEPNLANQPYFVVRRG